MARKRRSRLEIVVDILNVLSRGCRKPTHIAAEANLAYDRMAKIIEELVDRGLVSVRNSEFCITPQGLKMLEAYRQWRRFLDAMGL